MTLKSVSDRKPVDHYRLNCLCCFPGQRFSGEKTHMFSTRSIRLALLNSNDDSDEEDFVWVTDLDCHHQCLQHHNRCVLQHQTGPHQCADCFPILGD